MKTNSYFYSTPSIGKNRWWHFLIGIALAFSGILGFGQLPMLFILQNSGISQEQMQSLPMDYYRDVLGNNLFFTLNLIPFVVGFGMLLLAFKFVHQRSVISFFTTRKQLDNKRFLTGFLTWFGLLGSVLAIQLCFDSSQLVWQYEPTTFFVLLLTALFLVPIQTGFEELLFRGYLFQWLGLGAKKGILVVLGSTALFGLMHASNPENDQLGWFAMLFYLTSGLFTALITIMDDGIELSWGFHTANNFIGIVFITNQWQVIQTDALFMDTAQPTISWDFFLTILVLYPLMFLFLAKKHKWSGWKQRLF